MASGREGAMLHRIQQLEQERDELRKDLEEVCMQQAAAAQRRGAPLGFTLGAATTAASATDSARDSSGSGTSSSTRVSEDGALIRALQENQAKIKEAQQRIEQLEKDVRVAKHEGTVLQMQLADTNQELDLARKEKEGLKDILKEEILKREGAAKALQETQEELKDTQRKLAETEAERDDARQQLEASHAQEMDLRDRLSGALQEAVAATSRLRGAQNEATSAREAVQQAREREAEAEAKARESEAALAEETRAREQREGEARAAQERVTLAYHKAQEWQHWKQGMQQRVASLARIVRDLRARHDAARSSALDAQLLQEQEMSASPEWASRIVAHIWPLALQYHQHHFAHLQRLQLLRLQGQGSLGGLLGQLGPGSGGGGASLRHSFDGAVDRLSEEAMSRASSREDSTHGLAHGAAEESTQGEQPQQHQQHQQEQQQHQQQQHQGQEGQRDPPAWGKRLGLGAAPVRGVRSSDSSLSTLVGLEGEADMLGQAAKEKVEVLMLLAQEEERSLLQERKVKALENSLRELKATLTQVTMEKVQALMQLAQAKAEANELSLALKRSPHLSPSPSPSPGTNPKPRAPSSILPKATSLSPYATFGAFFGRSPNSTTNTANDNTSTNTSSTTSTNTSSNSTTNSATNNATNINSSSNSATTSGKSATDSRLEGTAAKGSTRAASDSGTGPTSAPQAHQGHTSTGPSQRHSDSPWVFRNVTQSVLQNAAQNMDRSRGENAGRQPGQSGGQNGSGAPRDSSVQEQGNLREGSTGGTSTGDRSSTGARGERDSAGGTGSTGARDSISESQEGVHSGLTPSIPIPATRQDQGTQNGPDVAGTPPQTVTPTGSLGTPPVLRGASSGKAGRGGMSFAGFLVSPFGQSGARTSANGTGTGTGTGWGAGNSGAATSGGKEGEAQRGHASTAAVSRLLLDVAELQESLESLGHMALQLRLLCRHAAGTLQPGVAQKQKEAAVKAIESEGKVLAAVFGEPPSDDEEDSALDYSNAFCPVASPTPQAGAKHKLHPGAQMHSNGEETTGVYLRGKTGPDTAGQESTVTEYGQGAPLVHPIPVSWGPTSGEEGEGLGLGGGGGGGRRDSLEEESDPGRGSAVVGLFGKELGRAAFVLVALLRRID